MQFAVLAFVMNKLEAAKNKLKQHNETERANELKQIQIGMLHDHITDLQNDGNPKGALNRQEQELLLEKAERGHGKQPNYIGTIKRLRERTGLGLGEAKGIVDNYLTEHGWR